MAAVRHLVPGTRTISTNRVFSKHHQTSMEISSCHNDGVGQAGIHPEQPALSVDREGFEQIWRHSVELLQRGFQSGSILTVDPEDAALLGTYGPY